jgi:hypothetical protein
VWHSPSIVHSSPRIARVLVLVVLIVPVIFN